MFFVNLQKKSFYSFNTLMHRCWVIHYNGKKRLYSKITFDEFDYQVMDWFFSFSLSTILVRNVLKLDVRPLLFIKYWAMIFKQIKYIQHKQNSSHKSTSTCSTKACFLVFLATHCSAKHKQPSFLYKQENIAKSLSKHSNIWGL